MRYLLVYEEVPEQTKFYSFDDPPSEHLTILERSHGTMVNSMMAPEKDLAAAALSALLVDRTPIGSFDSNPLDGPFDRVFFAGFIL